MKTGFAQIAFFRYDGDRVKEWNMNRPRVFVAYELPAGLNQIRAVCDADVWPHTTPPPRAELLERVRGCDGLLALLTIKIDGELLDAAGPQLKVVSNMAVGVDNIDISAATERGIVVGNTPGVLTETTADLAWALLLAAARRVVEAERYVRDGQWQTWDPSLLLGRDVYGATLGVAGFGRIGQAVARRAQGFGMRVLYTNRSGPLNVESAAHVDWDTLLGESDFVSIHTPLTPDTRHLFNREAFERMKPSAILINTARGQVIDQAALYDALRSGQLAAAALDVTDPEPLPADDPLLTLPNCIVVPHIGSASIATRDRMATIATQNLLAGVRGEPLLHCVNPEVYGR
jgi:lactate dehydrogenase-like 2-hydroxyacid dehydrogenase